MSKMRSAFLIRRCLSSSSFVDLRDVLLFDSSFPFLPWAEQFSQQRNSKSRITATASLMHPRANHIISLYASYIHNRSSYNFNSLGEFSLGLSAGTLLPKVSSNSCEPLEKNSISHSLLLWPDGLWLHGLKPENIPDICQLLTKRDSISVDMIQHTFKGNQNDITIESLSKPTLIFAMNSKLTASKLLQFQQSIDEELSGTENHGKRDEKGADVVEYILSTELGGHRNATEVMLIPSGDYYEGVINPKVLVNAVKRIYGNSDLHQQE